MINKKNPSSLSPLFLLFDRSSFLFFLLATDVSIFFSNHFPCDFPWKLYLFLLKFNNFFFPLPWNATTNSEHKSQSSQAHWWRRTLSEETSRWSNCSSRAQSHSIHTRTRTPQILAPMYSICHKLNHNYQVSIYSFLIRHLRYKRVYIPIRQFEDSWELFKPFCIPFSALSASKLSSHDPFVSSTCLKQTNESGLCPMQRHHILE